MGTRTPCWSPYFSARAQCFSRITVQGLKHSIYSAGYGYAEKPAIIYSLQEVLPTMKLVMSEPDKRGRQEIRMAHRLIGKWNDDGTEKLVYLVILEKVSGHFHYDHGVAK